MYGKFIIPVPPLDELDSIEGGGGQDNLGPGHVVDGVVDITEVAHWGIFSKARHVLVVVVGREVLVKNAHPLVLPTAHLTGDGLAQAAHGCGHLHSPIRRHAVHLEGQGGCFPTGH